MRGSDMSEIDRRTLFGMAGTGLVLAGCNPRGGGGNPNRQASIEGTCKSHGQSVSEKVPRIKGDVKSFLPDRVCIIYISFESNKMRVRRTYIDRQPTIPDDAQISNSVLTEL